MPKDDKDFFTIRQGEARNRLEHWLKKTSTAHKTDRAGKLSAATDTDKTEITVEGADRYVFL